MQHFDVGLEQIPGALERILDDAADLGVDFDGGLLGIVLGLRDVAAEEDLIFLFSERHRPEALAHPPFADHTARQVGRFFEVVAGAGGRVAEHQFFRHPTAEHDGEALENIVFREGVPVIDGQLLGDAQRHAARDDGDLVDRVRPGRQPGDQRVAGFVVGRVAAFGDAQDHAAPLRAHQHLVLGQLEVGHLDFFFVLAGGEQRGLVDQILQVGARQSGRAARQPRDVDVVVHGDFAGVDAQDFLASAHVGRRDHDPPVETAGAQQGRVQDVGPVGRRDQDHALVRLETVHLDEQLVERLFAFVVAAAQPGAAMPADRVDLVDEDDARRLLLALDEEVAHPRRADADEHLDEIGPADRKERDAGLARNRTREQRLARARRADEQHALGNPSAQAGEFLGVLEKGDDFFEFLLGLFHAGHVVERDFLLVLVEHSGAALAEGHRLAAAHLHLPHEEDPHADQQQHRKPLDQDGDVPRVALVGARRDSHAVFAQRAHQIRVVVGRERLEAFVVAEFPADDLALNEDLGDLAVIDRVEEVAEHDLGLAELLVVEEIEDQQEHQPQHEP